MYSFQASLLWGSLVYFAPFGGDCPLTQSKRRSRAGAAHLPDCTGHVLGTPGRERAPHSFFSLDFFCLGRGGI